MSLSHRLQNQNDKSPDSSQKYEDQIGKERSGHQKELSMRLNEAQTQFDRLYQSSEQERENLRTQYEQRMENMKLAALAQENSKKV